MAKGYKTGGRQAGTPNKTTAAETKNVADFLQRYRRGELTDAQGEPVSMEADFCAMSPTDRVVVATRMQAMITPKPIDIETSANPIITIEAQLAQLASDNAK